jgi:hypothetical protein
MEWMIFQGARHFPDVASRRAGINKPNIPVGESLKPRRVRADN